MLKTPDLHILCVGTLTMSEFRTAVLRHKRPFHNRSFRESSPEQVGLDNLGCGLVGKRTGLDAAHVGPLPILLDLSMHTTCEVAAASDKSWIRAARWMLYIAAACGDHRAAPIDVRDLGQLDPLGA